MIGTRLNGSVVSIADLQRLAQRRLPKQIFDFVEGGAGDELTLRANRAAFERISLRPKYLTDAPKPDLSTTVLGEKVSMPILLAPAGLQSLVHREGELATARASDALRTIFALSTQSSFPLEAVAQVTSSPLWFQTYAWRDHEVLGNLVARALKSGYRALVITVDVPVVGTRERDIRNGMTIPPRITIRSALDAARKPRWLLNTIAGPPITFGNFTTMEDKALPAVSLIKRVQQLMIESAGSWKDLQWLRSVWPHKLVVKGILTAEDARLAVESGVDGIIVSNHGGRQLDSVPAAIEALPSIVDAVGDVAEVLLDGGVRRGTDVVKALSLGARAVLVGRPYWYGLAVAGEAGVSRALQILHDELEQAMALMGRSAVTDLDPAAVSSSVSVTSGRFT
jgi:L-lactate dehydrogenase (cytochrome)